MLILKKLTKAYLRRAFWTLAGAFTFWAVSYFAIWELTNNNRLITYILNGLVILLVIIEDKWRLNHLAKKDKLTPKNRIAGMLFDYLIAEKYDNSSMKSSLYLFYIFSLVTSHILMLSPNLGVSESVRSYFTIIGYSLVILMAVDKFVAQFIKDDKKSVDYNDSLE